MSGRTIGTEHWFKATLTVLVSNTLCAAVHLQKLQVELKLAGVNVFGNPAKKDSLILQLPDVRSTIGADAAAPLLRAMLCGRVYVKWPYLQEAEVSLLLVVAVVHAVCGLSDACFVCVALRRVCTHQQCLQW